MDKRHYLSYTVAVFIPLLQAGIIGVLAGAVAALVLSLFEIPSVAAYGCLAAALTASLSWLSSVRWWRMMLESSTTPRSEILPLYQPEPEPHTVKIELIEHGGNSGSYIDLPVAPSKLQALASGLQSGKSFTESSWCGGGGIFSRAEFCQLRDEMLRRGLLALNSPRTPARGYHLTRGGLACVRYLATATTPLIESSSTYSDNSPE